MKFGTYLYVRACVRECVRVRVCVEIMDEIECDDGEGRKNSIL